MRIRIKSRYKREEAGTTQHHQRMNHFSSTKNSLRKNVLPQKTNNPIESITTTLHRREKRKRCLKSEAPFVYLHHDSFSIRQIVLGFLSSSLFPIFHCKTGKLFPTHHRSPDPFQKHDRVRHLAGKKKKRYQTFTFV